MAQRKSRWMRPPSGSFSSRSLFLTDFCRRLVNPGESSVGTLHSSLSPRGCMITSDRSSDDLIHPGHLSDYATQLAVHARPHHPSPLHLPPLPLQLRELAQERRLSLSLRNLKMMKGTGPRRKWSESLQPGTTVITTSPVVMMVRTGHGGSGAIHLFWQVSLNKQSPCTILSLMTGGV